MPYVATSPEMHEILHKKKVVLEKAAGVLVLIVGVVLFLGYRICLVRRRMQEPGESAPGNRMEYLRRFLIGICMPSTSNPGGLSGDHGLDKPVIDRLPLFIFKPIRAENIDDFCYCMVCFDEFRDGEKGRLLPQCGHFFHASCIEMWFFSHQTCPLCRDDVGSYQEASSETVPATCPPCITLITAETGPQHTLHISGVSDGLCLPETHTSGKTPELSQPDVDLELGKNVDLVVGEHVGRKVGDHGSGSQQEQRLADKYSSMDDLHLTPSLQIKIEKSPDRGH